MRRSGEMAGMAGKTDVEVLSHLSGKLASEAARLRRDVKKLLELFAAVEPDPPEQPEYEYEKTLGMSLHDVRSAAKAILACETDMTFIRNVLSNADLQAVFKR